MTASFTTVISLTNAWQSVISGPVAGILFFESTATDCEFAISNATPSVTTRGHTIFPGTQYTLPLETGSTLYVRSRSITGASLTYTYTDGALLPALDQRVYEGRFKAITTQPFTEANVKNGTQFYTSHEFLSIAQSGTANIVIQTGTMPVLVKGREVRTNGDNILYEVFRGPTTSGGTVVTIGNYNEVSPAATTVSMVHTATVSATGTLIDSQPIYGSVSAGNRVSGFNATAGVERRLAPSTKYLVRLTNRSTTAEAAAWVALTWYEGPLSTEA